MDLLQLARTVIRRFYIFIPLALLSLLIAMQVSGRINADYTVSGSAVLVGPSVSPDGATGEDVSINPYLSFSSSLNTTGQVLALTAESSAARGRMASAGLPTNYDVAVEGRSPVIHVSATGESADAARAAVAWVLDFMSQDLADRQASVDAPPDRRITMTVPAAPGGANADDSGSARVRLVILGLGLLLAVAASVGVDAALTARQAGREAGEPWPGPTHLDRHEELTPSRAEDERPVTSAGSR